MLRRDYGEYSVAHFTSAVRTLLYSQERIKLMRSCYTTNLCIILAIPRSMHNVSILLRFCSGFAGVIVSGFGYSAGLGYISP